MTAPGSGVVLVALEEAGAALGRASLEMLSLARAVGPVHGVWFGEPATEAMGQAGRHGAVVVHHVGPRPRSSAEIAHALTVLVRTTGADVVLLPATVDGTEVAALTAHALDGALVVGAASVGRDDEGHVVAEAAAFTGTWAVRARTRRPLTVVTVRPNAVQASEVSSADVVELLPVAVGPMPPSRVEVLERRPLSVGRPDLAQAPVVVVGGRGTGGDFGPLEELAQVLGGAVGATRVATEEGWISQDTQVGQTGVNVSPRLYIGAGVSGAIHHRGGMQASQTIVAINLDHEAPIFDIADVGVVGDLFRIVPELTAELRRRLA